MILACVICRKKYWQVVLHVNPDFKHLKQKKNKTTTTTKTTTTKQNNTKQNKQTNKQTKNINGTNSHLASEPLQLLLLLKCSLRRMRCVVLHTVKPTNQPNKQTNQTKILYTYVFHPIPMQFMHCSLCCIPSTRPEP